jgi:hypothetical protein
LWEISGSDTMKNMKLICKELTLSPVISLCMYHAYLYTLVIHCV